MASKKASPGDEGNASDFIRSQPVGTTAPEVVEAGQKAGFDFSTSLVYAVRGRMKKSGGAASSPPRREENVAPRRAPAAPPGGGRLEAQIEELVRAFVRDMSALVRRAALDSVRDALGERR